MSLFSLLFEGRASLENPRVPLSSLVDNDVWESVFGERWGSDAGESVGVDRALSLSPVWMAVKMISGDCSKIPLKIHRRRANGGGKDIDRTHPAWRFIHNDRAANEDTSALQLWRTYFASALLWENGYIWIDRDNLGNIHGLYNLPPDRTAPVRAKGKLWYVTEVQTKTGAKLESIPAADVLHLRGLCWDGQTAPALVRMARHDFGVALAARKFTSKFFSNNCHAGGVLQLPPGHKETARVKIEQALTKQRSGTDQAFRSFVLRDGYRFFSTQVDPDKAKLIDLDESQVRHAARWFLLHPSRLGTQDTVSYNSLEAAKRDYHDTTLSYWLTANQAECNTKLLDAREQRDATHVLRYQVNALLWADAKTRNEIAVSGIQSGRFSPDETRNWEGLNPRDDGEGDKFLRPLNMTAVGADPPAAGNNPADNANLP